MNVALIIGRKGSTGFPGKNTMPILGRPLCAYPILAAKHSWYVSDVYVSTDDEKIAKIGKELDCKIIDRPPELCTKEALGEDAFKHGYEVAKEQVEKRGEEIELLVLLFCNAATLLASTIDEGIEVLWEHDEYDSAVTVSCYNMWSPLRARKIGEDGLLHPFVPFETFGDPKTLNCDRDSQGDAWFADVAVSVVRPHCMENMEAGLLPQKWMGQKIYPIKQRAGCDIDYAWQVPGVEFWLRDNGFSENSTPYDR